jgi:hypothetical protein
MEAMVRNAGEAEVKIENIAQCFLKNLTTGQLQE